MSYEPGDFGRMPAQDMNETSNRITELERQRQQDLKTIDTLARELQSLRVDHDNIVDWLARFHGSQARFNNLAANAISKLGGVIIDEE